MEWKQEADGSKQQWMDSIQLPTPCSKKATKVSTTQSMMIIICSLHLHMLVSSVILYVWCFLLSLSLWILVISILLDHLLYAYLLFTLRVGISFNDCCIALKPLCQLSDCSHIQYLWLSLTMVFLNGGNKAIKAMESLPKSLEGDQNINARIEEQSESWAM